MQEDLFSQIIIKHVNRPFYFNAPHFIISLSDNNRFPMKNKQYLKCWEQFGMHTNMLKDPWKATIYSRIYSDHFRNTDYIIAPSSNLPCRLKKYAKPSRSTPSATMSFPHSTMMKELQCRLGHSNNRSFSSRDYEDMSPVPEKFPKISEEKRDELQKKT